MTFQPRSTWTRAIDVDESADVISAVPTVLTDLIIVNTTAATALFFKIYNKATAATASDTPVLTIPLAPATPFAPPLGKGLELSNGLSVRCTTGVADADTGAPSANACVCAFATRPL